MILIRDQGVGVRAHLIWMLKRRILQMSKVDRRTWRYHAERPAQIFDSPEAVPEGEGWQTAAEWFSHGQEASEPAQEAAEAPAEDAGEPEAAEGDAEDEETERKRLRAILKEAGVKLPPRAGIPKLREIAAEAGVDV